MSQAKRKTTRRGRGNRESRGGGPETPDKQTPPVAHDDELDDRELMAAVCNSHTRGLSVKEIVVKIKEEFPTYVLDEICDNETELSIREHTTDTAGATEIIFALFDLLGYRFTPRLGLQPQLAENLR